MEAQQVVIGDELLCLAHARITEARIRTTSNTIAYRCVVRHFVGMYLISISLSTFYPVGEATGEIWVSEW